MKLRNVILFALSALVFVSCSEKDYYDESKNPKEVADLDIPADFDWKMTAEVDCNFTASVPTPVEVYTEASCTAYSLVAEYTLAPNQEALPLVVPAHVSKLYVKIDGVVTPVDVKNGVAQFEVSNSRAAASLSRAEADANDSDYAWVYFPSKETLATVMFEDNFPVEGDYDFNDFVANYKYEMKLSTKQGGGKDPDKFHVISVDFTMKVKALGGLYTYIPHLRMSNMKVGKEGFTGNGATLVTENPDPIIRFDIDPKGMKPEGALFLNTDPEEPSVPYSQLQTITFKIESNNDTGTGAKDIEFDFYLEGVGHEGGTFEIHQRGFKPVNGNYPSGYGLKTNPHYVNEKNLVWGFTVPADVKHTTERTNFLKAYPKFQKWAETAGDENEDWYKTGDSSYLF